MEDACDTTRTECCGLDANVDFPLPEALAQECAEYISKQELGYSGYLGLWFKVDKDSPSQSNTPVAMAFRIPTNVPWSGTFRTANDARLKFEAWFYEQLETAPAELREK